MDRYKACLVARGFTQTYEVGYLERFSLVGHLNSIRVMFSMVVNHQWLMFQLNVKNGFQYADPEDS